MTVVSADQTVPLTPKNLPKSNATLNVTYSGDITGITVTTPDGRTFEAASDGTGKVSCYLGDAPAGVYTVVLKGSFISFSVTITGDSPAPPPTTTTSAPPPPPPTTTSPPPTTIVPPLPPPTQEPVKPTSTSTSETKRQTEKLKPSETPQETIQSTIPETLSTTETSVALSTVNSVESDTESQESTNPSEVEIIPVLGIIANSGNPTQNYLPVLAVAFALGLVAGIIIGVYLRQRKIARNYLNEKYGSLFLLEEIEEEV